jgi:glycosyltransferase involved in cell wall biosynthesis
VHAAAFDVAHLHACRNLPGGWAAGALERAGVPYVLAPNGTAPSLERYHAAKLAFDALLGRAVLDRASCLLAVSEAEHRQLRSLGVEAGRIRVIGNPVPAHEFSALPPKGTFRAAHRLGEGPLVVFLGKLTARKRVDVVLDAFAALDMPAATLAIAGNDMGAGAGARERAARLGLGARVRFTGLVEGAGRLEALADADVVVYPSEHEIFGLVPLEALLCGTPVVVAGDSGCGEVVAAVGGGLVVPVGDAAALAVAISRVLCHRAEWIAAAALARDEVIRRFDAPVIAAALDETYGRVLH